MALDNMLAGLSLSLTGLVLTFAALGLFILTIVVLKRLFGTARQAQATPQRARRLESPTSTLERVSEDEEIVVAITLALSRLRSLAICRSGLGTALEAGRGRYWMALPQQPPAGARQNEEPL